MAFSFDDLLNIPTMGLYGAGKYAATGSPTGGGVPGLSGGLPGNNDFQPNDYQRTGDYNPNDFNYGGYAGGARDASGLYGAKAGEYGAQQENLYNYGVGGLNNAGAARGYQMDALGMARDRAMGNDLISQRIAQQQAQLLAQQQASAAASARGPGALVLAQQNAAGNTAFGQSTIANSAMTAGAQERLGYQNAYAGQAAGLRAGDYQGAGVAFGAGAQSGQLGYGYSGLQNNVQQSQLQAAMQKQGLLAGSHAQGQQIGASVAGSNADNSKDWANKFMGLAQGGVGSAMTPGMGGGAAPGGASAPSAPVPPPPPSPSMMTGAGPVDPSYLSDARMKLGILPLDGLMGHGQSAGGGPFANPAGYSQMGAGGGMDVMGSLRANSNAGTAFQGNAGSGPYSDARAKMGAQHEGRAMTHALASGLAPYSYEYKPGMGEPGPNVGPMAQNMASNPVTGVAVERDPSGLMVLDRDRLAKLTAGGVGHLAERQAETDARLDAISHHLGLYSRAA